MTSSQELVPNIDGPIRFKSVVFRYPLRPEVTILNNLSLTIKPGTKVAFVGESGSGKSTIFQVIAKFYNLDRGSLTFNGSEISSLDDDYLRSNISVVNQEPHLFSRSILENITYGAIGDIMNPIAMGQVADAAKAANIHEFIAGLPEGYDTEVGEQGSLFSGGQKQRIAIARAFFREPKILILDEATSALDAISKKQVEEIIHAYPGKVTIIAITHDFKSLDKYDQIYVLASGQIAEEGSFGELIDKKGLFYGMYNSRNQ